MRLLFLVPYTPNLIRTRPYNLLRHLRRRGHAITLLTLYTNTAEQADLAALEAEGITILAEPLTHTRVLANSLGALPTGDPLQASYCWQPALARRLTDLLAAGGGEPPFDVIHVEHLRGARYALLAKELVGGPRTTDHGPWTMDHGPSSIVHRPSSAVRHPSSIVYRPSSVVRSPTPIIWDSVDCISHLFRQAAAHSSSRFGRWITRLELPRTERYEGRLAWQFDTVLTTSAVDEAALTELADRYRLPTSPTAAQPPVQVLPNGVDLDYFQPDPAVVREPATLVLSGKMSYHANVTMAVHLVRDIMPLVWQQRPEVCVWIAGKDPAPEVTALAEGEPRVTVTGTVPDVRPYLQRATLAVAPITYGAGIQNKVLEAMACGTAVVASPPAIAALAAVPGRDLQVGRDNGEMAGQIVTLLADPMRLASVAGDGLAYVRANHRWTAIAAKMEGIYVSLSIPQST